MTTHRLGLFLTFFAFAVASVPSARVAAQTPNAPPPAAVVRAAGPISWASSFEVARSGARDGQLILVDVSTDWCSWCQFMDAQIFPDVAVRELASGNVFVKIDPKDGGAGQTFAKKQKVKAYPTFFVFTPDGKLVRKQVGAFDRPSDFIAWVQGRR
jgi:thiol:disulfide interchange protein